MEMAHSNVLLSLVVAILVVNFFTTLVLGFLVHKSGVPKQAYSDALKLAHDVANDAMIHLTTRDPLQAVQVQVERNKGNEAVKASSAEQQFLLERMVKQAEKDDLKRANTPDPIMKDVDGNAYHLSDFTEI